MTYSSTKVELNCGAGPVDHQVKALSIKLQRKLIRTAADFLEAHTLPRGVVLVINGESAEQEIMRQALGDALSESIGEQEPAHV